MATAQVVGIDLGTTYSCISVFRNGRTEVIPVKGRATLASCVAFTGDADLGNFVGQEARDKMYKYPKGTVFDAKRMIGRLMTDPKLVGPMLRWPFSIHETEEHHIQLEVPAGDGTSQMVTPEEICCMVLETLVDAAHQKFHSRPEAAVITVPAYFNEAQRQATKDAADLAGLEVRRLINEPTAAAIAYGLENPQPQERKVLVFDLGGGTFDISLLTMKGNTITTEATTGDDQLGGNDFDQRILDWLVQELVRDFPEAYVAADALVVARLRAQVEDLKIAVNQVSRPNASAIVKLEDAVSIHTTFRRVLTTQIFNDLNADQFNKCFRGSGDKGEGGLDELFGMNGEGGKYKRADVDEVLAVGGSTNIPRIRQMLMEYFRIGQPGVKTQLNLTLNADEAVARGAAAMSAIVTRDNNAYRDGQAGVVIDVCSHSYGIRLHNGLLDHIIKKNTALPAHKSVDTYTTVTDTDTKVCIQVYQGEYTPRANDNRNIALGTILLTDIHQPGGGRLPKLQVTMDLDTSGLLQVTAQDITPGSQGRPVPAEYKLNGPRPREWVDDKAAVREVERNMDNLVLE